MPKKTARFEIASAVPPMSNHNFFSSFDICGLTDGLGFKRKLKSIQQKQTIKLQLQEWNELIWFEITTLWYKKWKDKYKINKGSKVKS